MKKKFNFTEFFSWACKRLALQPEDIEIIWCSTHDESFTIWQQGGLPQIRIPKKAEKGETFSLLVTLHELKHCQQYIMGRVKTTGLFGIVFDNVDYFDFVPHKERPWEREAIIESHYLITDWLKEIERREA